MGKTAVLLIAHGSPERVEDIPEFLQNISRGRPMSEAVVREVQHRYSLIGSSPLTQITRQQADNVARELGMPVYVGMRNWHPFIADALKQMASDNVGQAVAVCLAPHNSRTTDSAIGRPREMFCRNSGMSSTRSGLPCAINRTAVLPIIFSLPRSTS